MRAVKDMPTELAKILRRAVNNLNKHSRLSCAVDDENVDNGIS